MKMRFYLDLFAPIYVTPPHAPFLMAYSCPAMKSHDATRLSFEIDIPDDLIKVQDVAVEAGPVTRS